MGMYLIQGINNHIPALSAPLLLVISSLLVPLVDSSFLASSMSIRLSSSPSCRTRCTFMSFNPSAFDFRLRVVRHVGIGLNLLAPLRRSRWWRLRASFGSSEDLGVVVGWHEYVEDGGGPSVSPFMHGSDILTVFCNWTSDHTPQWRGEARMVVVVSWWDPAVGSIMKKLSFSWKRRGSFGARVVSSGKVNRKSENKQRLSSLFIFVTHHLPLLFLLRFGSLSLWPRLPVERVDLAESASFRRSCVIVIELNCYRRRRCSIPRQHRYSV